MKRTDLTFLGNSIAHCNFKIPLRLPVRQGEGVENIYEVFFLAIMTGGRN